MARIVRPMLSGSAWGFALGAAAAAAWVAAPLAWPAAKRAAAGLIAAGREPAWRAGDARDRLQELLDSGAETGRGA